MSLARIFFILFSCLCAVLPQTVQAELQLEKWKTYGQMAEQSAICASFSKLMEAQSVLNPDLGALWQERSKFVGTVIRKAVFLELGRDSTEDEIDKLIASYRDWVLSSLMITDNNLTDEGNDAAKKAGTDRHKIETLMKSQCKSLFQQSDEIIREQRPDLVYLLRNISVAQAKPNNSLSEKSLVTQTDTTRVTPLPSSSGKAVELSIGGGSSFTLTLPGQPAPSDKRPSQNTSEQADISKSKPVPPKLVQISGPVSRPDQKQIKTPSQANNIKAALSAGTAPSATPPALIPVEPEQKAGGYFAQLGAFALLDNARAEKQRLENKFSALFAELPLHIAEVTDSGPRFYRIKTMSRSQKHIKTLCDVLWSHKIDCLIKPQNAQ